MSPFFISLKSAGESVKTESITLFTFGVKGATPVLIISSPIFSGILITVSYTHLTLPTTD